MTLSEFFFKVSLYQKIPVVMFDISHYETIPDENPKIISLNPHIYYDKEKLCIQSLKHIFNKNNSGIGSIRGYNPIKNYDSSFKIQEEKALGLTTLYPIENPIIGNGGVTEITLVCKQSEDEFHFMVHWNPTDNTLMKVGQYPSYIDIHRYETKKYYSVLDKDKLKEFVRAIGLHANGVGIVSFVYLRRIFEYMIGEASKEYVQNTSYDIQDIEGKRMDEKIRILKNYLPEFLVKNSSIYSVLSKGIHELSEDECLDYFDTVKNGIEIILDQKLEIENKRKKEEQATRDLQKISTKLSGGSTS